MEIPGSHTASGLPWQLRNPDTRIATAIAQQHGLSELLGGILAGRDIVPDDVPLFLAPTLRDMLPDPFHLRDMDKAVARLITAITNKERIAVFGDYDVDGATSTALLLQYFAALGIDLIPYIPDRMTEGYGPSVEGFRKLIEGTANPSTHRGEDGRGAAANRSSSEESSLPGSPPPNLPPMGGGTNGVSLIITVDCGTLAHEPIAYAQGQGVDVIVLDHHLSSGALPNAHAIVNPNRVDETSDQRHLAAVGVTFLTLVALSKTLRENGFFHDNEPPLLPMLDLVALGTVCDVMPLTGLNRAFVAQGLKVMAARRNLGLSLLADVARLDTLPNVYHLGFLLGPRINAGGRVGASGLGVELLTSADPDQARDIAAKLDVHNSERQAIEAGVSAQAFALAESQQNMPVILVAGEGWHPGVIGIVAGRLKEKYSRPAIVVALENGIGKASARSVTGADMGAAIHAAVAQNIIPSGGGHAMAAGFSLAADAIPALHEFLIDRMGPAVTAYQDARVLRFDATLSASGANLDTLDEIALAGPYGMGNPGPRFVLPNAQILHRTVMKEKHLRLTIGDHSGNARLTAVAFNAVGTPIGEWLTAEKQLHLLGELKANSWQGRESAQFLIDDAARISTA